jgi:hypothetical protein
MVNRKEGRKERKITQITSYQENATHKNYMCLSPVRLQIILIFTIVCLYMVLEIKPCVAHAT